MFKKSLAITIAIIASQIMTPSASATGLMTCDGNEKSQWKTMDQLKTQMKDDGWTVRRIKEDGGCYEAYGTTPEGKRVEAYFHPVTLELLLVAQRGQILFRKQDQ
ncbi:MAG: PepSY domain-containing protein [Rhizobiaceae bacterium]